MRTGDPDWCETCQNAGEIDCRCGGEVCACGDITLPCPDCGRAFDEEPENDEALMLFTGEPDSNLEIF